MYGLTIAASLMALLTLVAANQFQGRGTAYSGPNDKDATGFNACGFGDLGSHWERFYGAMNSAQFGGDVCGKCVRVRGIDSGASGKSFLVKITDECPTCGHGDVDFSTTALEAITGFSWDRKRISWEFADCDGATDAQGEEHESEEEKERKERKQAEEEAAEKERKQAEEEQRKEEEAAAEAEKELADEEAADEVEAASPPPPKSDDTEEAKVAQEDQPQEKPVGTYSRWVVKCIVGGRKRCPNLALASQGYQCANAAGDSCCLTASGKGCKAVDSIKDEGVAWKGRRANRPAAAAQQQAAQEGTQQTEQPTKPEQPAQGLVQEGTEQAVQGAAQPAESVAQEVASAATDAFAAAAAAVTSIGNRKMMLR